MSWGGGLRGRGGLACVSERDKRAGVIPGEGSSWETEPRGVVRRWVSAPRHVCVGQLSDFDVGRRQLILD